jgi:hypothetical protein
LLIDGDAIAYMIGWNYREFVSDAPQDVIWAVENSVNRFMEDLFTLTDSKLYLGIISSEANRKNFRYDVYKYKPYKGNREEEPDWIRRWKPVINEHLLAIWGFQRSPEELETDDIIAGVHNSYAEMYRQTQGHSAETIVCSPDKDMKQLPGQHYCYRTQKQDFVLEAKALWNWCMQMLCGDDTDNIAGVPGLGPKKSEKLLSEGCAFEWKEMVRLAYEKYFGAYYGNIIHEETAAAITLMSPAHPLWEFFGFDVGKFRSLVVTSD